MLTARTEARVLSDQLLGQLREDDQRFLWHPWTPQRHAAGLTLVSGWGARVYDAEGREYIDARSASGAVSCGYGRAEIAEAMADQARTLATYDLKGFSTPPAIGLAARYASLMPGPLNRTLFVNSGSEAIEAAIKLARMLHALRGQPARQVIVSFEEGYHGATLAAAACTSSPVVRGGWEPAPEGFVALPAPRGGSCRAHSPDVDCSASCADVLDAVIGRIGGQSVAAVVMEPVLGLAGVVIPPEGYLRRVRDICTEHGVLLVLDEVMTGFARTGRMFGFEHEGVLADVVTTGKGVTGGYAPLAAMTASDEIFETFATDEFLGGFRHGHTTSGHATACAAGLAALDIITGEDLAERADTLGQVMRDRLAELEALPFVREVRGLGLLIGVDLDTAAHADAVTGLAQERGVLVLQRDHVITVAPPLVLDDETAARICAVLAECCRLLAEGRVQR